ncbi:MAG: hypothetical protein ACYC61_05385, partial [Isosphaeraceae bacterium]
CMEKNRPAIRVALIASICTGRPGLAFPGSAVQRRLAFGPGVRQAIHPVICSLVLLEGDGLRAGISEAIVVGSSKS